MRRGLVTNTGAMRISRQLLEDPELDVIFVTEPRFRDNYPEHARLIFVDSLNDPAAATQRAIETMDLTDREFVIALSDRAAITAAYLRSVLGLPGTDILQTLNSTNKFTMKRRFREEGLPVADFTLCGSPEDLSRAVDEIGLPVIIKPVMSAGADAIFVARTSEDLEGPALAAYINRLMNPATTSEKEFPVIVERLLEVTNEYHCDGFVVEGELRYVRVSRYIVPVLGYEGKIYGSETLPESDPRAQQILEMHRTAIRAVGLRDSLTHFEVLEASGEFYAGEIAGRPGGGGIRRMLQLRDGFDSTAAHLAVSMNLDYSWTAPERSGGEYAELLVPAKRGRITAMTPVSTLEEIPHVVEVESHLSVGEVVDGLTDSSTYSAALYVQLDPSGDVSDVVANIAGVFSIEAEPVGT